MVHRANFIIFGGANLYGFINKSSQGSFQTVDKIPCETVLYILPARYSLFFLWNFPKKGKIEDISMRTDAFFLIYQSKLPVSLDSWMQKEDSAPFPSSESHDTEYNAYCVFPLHQRKHAQLSDFAVCRFLHT